MCTWGYRFMLEKVALNSSNILFYDDVSIVCLRVMNRFCTRRGVSENFPPEV
jgi:hypothetical protein